MIEPHAEPSRPAARVRRTRRPVAPVEVALTSSEHDEVLRRRAARRLVAG